MWQTQRKTERQEKMGRFKADDNIPYKGELRRLYTQLIALPITPLDAAFKAYESMWRTHPDGIPYNLGDIQDIFWEWLGREQTLKGGN